MLWLDVGSLLRLHNPFDGASVWNLNVLCPCGTLVADLQCCLPGLKGWIR
jgi:hypothetical protein